MPPARNRWNAVYAKTPGSLTPSLVMMASNRFPLLWIVVGRVFVVAGLDTHSPSHMGKNAAGSHVRQPPEAVGYYY